MPTLSKCLLFIMSLELITGHILKRKMCLHFEIDSYHIRGRPYYEVTSPTKTQCMMECVSHVSCKGYRYRRSAGDCELLSRGPPRCMEPSFVPGVEYVSIGECKGSVAWQVLEPVTRGGEWLTTVEQHNHDDFVKVESNGNIRYISRVLMSGIYHIGWTMNSVFYTIYTGRRSMCSYPSRIQYLSFNNASAYTWVPFAAVTKVPSNAIIGGYWMDGSPFVIAKTLVGNDYYIGYYRSDVCEAFINSKSGHVRQPKMQILVYIWNDYLFNISKYARGHYCKLQLYTISKKYTGKILSFSPVRDMQFLWHVIIISVI